MLVRSLGQVHDPDGALIAFDVNDFDLVAVTSGALSWPYTIVLCYSIVLGMPIPFACFSVGWSEATALATYLGGSSICIHAVTWADTAYQNSQAHSNRYRNKQMPNACC